MSLFDVLKHQPFPDNITTEWIETLPPQVQLRYRVWYRKHYETVFTTQEIKDEILYLLKKHEREENESS